MSTTNDPSQKARLLEALADGQELSSFEIVSRLRIINTTGRISDLRADGHDIRATRDDEGVWRFRLVVPFSPTLGL